ncbi:MAG: hypothetical protein WCG29_02920 [Desulfomonile sp.]|jgi:hypothetical protein|nr:hypothetical protein [Deltaproteobacteria bacterium]
MEIMSVEEFSVNSLIQGLKKVTMLKAPEIKVYENAFISLEKISPACLAPPQNYILREELKKVRQLKWALEHHGIDIFHLNGFVRLSLEGTDEPVDLLPPVVEESIEADGSIHFIVNDGMHRVYMALREWMIPQVVLIRGIPKQFPYYAFPVPGGWNSIEEKDDLPPGYLKKWHRCSDYHSLYRNFNSAFSNVGGPREFFKKSG